MPHISISLYKGRNKLELETISKIIETSLVEKLAWKPEDISVSIEELDRENFIERVNKKCENDKLFIGSALIK